MLKVASYYSYKLLNRIRLKRLSFHQNIKSLPGIIKFLQDFPFRRQIILCFGDAQLVHYGDQLFFLPVALLLKRFDFQITIFNPGKLLHLWEYFNFPIVSDSSRFYEGALCISKDDMFSILYPLLLKHKCHFIGFNFGKMNGSEAISKLVAIEIISLIQQLDTSFNIIPTSLNSFFEEEFSSSVIWESLNGSTPKCLLKLDQVLRQKSIVFSDFLNSGFWQAAWRRHHLYKLADELNRDFTLIYVGSQMEKKLSKPSFINIDLRGETLPSDLFYLFSHPLVVGYAGFDTYPLHVATLCGKSLYVVKKSSFMDEKKFIPFLPNHEKLVRIIK